jgi:hypothetical protein
VNACEVQPVLTGGVDFIDEGIEHRIGWREQIDDQSVDIGGIHGPTRLQSTRDTVDEDAV